MSELSLMTFPLNVDIATKSMTVRDSLQMAADCGIAYVDVMRVKRKNIPIYREAMTATGTKVYCYISYNSFLAKAAVIRETLRQDLKIASELGAKLMMIVPYLPFMDERRLVRLDRTTVLNKMVDGFSAAVEESNSFGISVCFEITPHEFTHLSGTEDCQYVLDHVPGLGLVFDTANMLPHGDSPLEAYEALKKYVVHVHLKDVALSEAKFSLLPCEHTVDGKRMQNAVFGEGVIPVKELYDRMRKDGYTGVFAIEYAHPGGRCDLQKNEAQLRKHLLHLNG